MKIIILGAGRVGTSTAANLVGEDNDITVVDEDSEVLRTLRERYDLRTVTGSASHPSVLEKAGAHDADMLIAVTDSDELNMLSCQIAYTLFHAPTKIAQVRNREYLDNAQLFRQEAIPIDVLICPEQIITKHVQRLIDYPGALQVLDFADGKVQLIGIKLYHQGSLVGQEISDFKTSLPNIDFRIVMIYRAGKPVLPDGNTVMQAEDEVFIIVAKKHARELLRTTSTREKPVRDIIIAGGGQIGRGLSLALEKEYSVKLLEIDARNANLASEQLKATLVLHGDTVDEDLLKSENIEQTDVFCAVTSVDEANIFSAMLAKRLGAKKVLSLINRPSYVDLLLTGSIDITISPQQITIGLLLAHVRRGDVQVVHSLRRGAAEAIEAIAHSRSKVVGRAVNQLELPPGTTIGAIVRDDDVVIAHSQSEIEDGDHVILLVSNKEYLKDVEKLFQVDITFL